jgi:hypothetical protein
MYKQNTKHVIFESLDGEAMQETWLEQWTVLQRLVDMSVKGGKHIWPNSERLG